MSTIARQFFADSPVIFFPVIALLLFLFLFIVVVVWSVRARRTEMDALARLPFGDAEETSRHD